MHQCTWLRRIAVAMLPVTLILVASGPPSAAPPITPQLQLTFTDGPYLVDFEGRFQARLLVSGQADPRQAWRVTLRPETLGVTDVVVSPASFKVRFDGNDFSREVAVTGRLRQRMEAGTLELGASLTPRLGQGVPASLRQEVPSLRQAFELNVGQSSFFHGWGFWTSQLWVEFAMNADKARIPKEDLALHLELGFCNTSGVIVPDLIEGQTFVLQPVMGVGLYDMNPPGSQRCWVETRIHLHDPVRDMPLESCQCVMREYL